MEQHPAFLPSEMDMDEAKNPKALASRFTVTLSKRQPTNMRYSCVVGDVNGQLSVFFGKIASLTRKHNFAIVIIAGQLFSAPGTTTTEQDSEVKALLDGDIEVAVPTYFSLGQQPLPDVVLQKLECDSGELCHNLSILGRNVSLKTADGFRIVAVGGTHSTKPASKTYEVTYTDEDALSEAKGLQDADILVTSNWPANITCGSKAYSANDPIAGVQSIAELCAVIKPRYHFSTSGLFFEREPFFHDTPAPRPVTRFISLASFGNSEREKYMYAFQLEPSAPHPLTLPENCTASPFHSNAKRKRSADEGGETNYRYGNGPPEQYSIDRRYERSRGGSNRRAPAEPRECFFCLSNCHTGTHMIAALGYSGYMTIAKGPLSTRTTYPGLGFPGHMLIIPVAHKPTLAALDEDDRIAFVDEARKYREGMHKMISLRCQDDQGRSKLGSVTWAINRNSGLHLHWQFIPVPVDLIHKGLVEAAFLQEAKTMSYPRFAKNDEQEDWAQDTDFFKVMIWSETLQKDLVLPLDNSFRFDLQFGRRVMAKLLGVQSRMRWGDCTQSTEEESVDAEAFKTAFAEFDFALQD